jgi:hypothetical protein
MSKFPSVPARKLLTVDCSLYSSQQILASTGIAQHGVSPVGVSSLTSMRSMAGFEIGPPPHPASFLSPCSFSLWL